MRRGYIDSRRRGTNVLGIAGWVVAALIAAAFAWYVIWGPRGGAGDPAEPTEAAAAMPTPTETEAASFPTAPPTEFAEPTATEAPPPTSTLAPLPTPTTAATATPSATATAGAEGANVRTGPGTYHEQIGSLEPGQSVPITGRYEKWLQVDFNGVTGWVANWVVTATNIDDVPQVDPPAATATATVQGTATPVVTATSQTPPPQATTPVSPTMTAGADGANVRAGPGTQFEQLGFIDPGGTAPIVGKYDKWYQIEYNGGLAWVANWVVTATGVESVPVVEPPPGTEPTATTAPS